MTRAFLAVRVAVSPTSRYPPSATRPGPAGPLTLTRRTVPSPSSELSLRTSIDASSLTCVAHAVESAAMTNSPPAKPSGRVWAARSGPTIWAQLLNTEPTAACSFQP